MHRSTVSLSFFLVLVSGCADVYLGAPDGDREVLTDGQVVPGSCATDDGDTCGAQSAGGCWCDAGCEQYGDCCADRVEVCEAEPEPAPEPEPSCATADGDTCGGQSDDGCWCDDGCAQYGDCCPDVAEVCDDEPVEPVPTCTEPATYRVTVDVTWDPSDVPNPHFSPLVGAVHGDDVSFWSVGGLASPGIETMAETGGTGPLVDEVEAAIDAGTAQAVVLGSPIPVSPGSASVDVELDGTHSRVTLVTMVAPSPDWFVGVDGIQLCEDGQWLEGSVDLTVWDAGTDSGSDFTSPNADTVPAGLVGPSDVFTGSAGTITFTRL